MSAICTDTEMCQFWLPWLNHTDSWSVIIVFPSYGLLKLKLTFRLRLKPQQKKCRFVDQLCVSWAVTDRLIPWLTDEYLMGRDRQTDTLTDRWISHGPWQTDTVTDRWTSLCSGGNICPCRLSDTRRTGQSLPTGWIQDAWNHGHIYYSL